MGPMHGTEACTTAAGMSTAAATISEAVFLFVASGMPSEQSERVLTSYILALRSEARGKEKKKIPAGQVGIFFEGTGRHMMCVRGTLFDVLS